MMTPHYQQSPQAHSTASKPNMLHRAPQQHASGHQQELLTSKAVITDPTQVTQACDTGAVGQIAEAEAVRLSL
jgi:hypothetical protein